ncbi:AraC family transcriptional regulator [Endozoicomonas sp. OPT23]|uniref:AraC family transcriptional regulator n=1 Tax=Endozoicomonas sp. OPT23 TaxID=2072845 RepID=UPI00129AD27D|nr:AraC family transcriptional regulator [Endozoicomonas sp. OPT23]
MVNKDKPDSLTKLGTASSAAVRQYLQAALDYGIDSSTALQACDIDPGVLDNSVPRISGNQFQSLIHWLVLQVDDDCFGLKSANYVEPGSYSLLGYMAMSCRTLEEVLNKVPEYEAIVGDMGTTFFEQNSDQHIMSWHCLYPDSVVRPHMISNVLGSWLNFSRRLADLRNARPEQVLLEFDCSSQNTRNHYEQVFEAPVVFNAGKNSLIFSSSVLNTPLHQPDPQLTAALEQQAIALLKQVQDNPIINQVRKVLTNMITEGLPRRERVAEQLGITERTLQRRLHDAGSGYQQLLDELRLDTAKRWLTSDSLSINEIASRLGFSEAASFHRRFKCWTGITPGEFRSSFVSSD